MNLRNNEFSRILFLRHASRGLSRGWSCSNYISSMSSKWKWIMPNHCIKLYQATTCIDAFHTLSSITKIQKLPCSFHPIAVLFCCSFSDFSANRQSCHISHSLALISGRIQISPSKLTNSCVNCDWCTRAYTHLWCFFRVDLFISKKKSWM